MNSTSILDMRSRACNCRGPQNGQPLCPCRMRDVHEVDGRYVETIDHGPVRPALTARDHAEWLGRL